MQGIVSLLGATQSAGERCGGSAGRKLLLLSKAPTRHDQAMVRQPLPLHLAESKELRQITDLKTVVSNTRIQVTINGAGGNRLALPSTTYWGAPSRAEAAGNDRSSSSISRFHARLIVRVLSTQFAQGYAPPKMAVT